MKIAVCTPCHGSPKAPFAEALAQMLIETTRQLRDGEIEVRIRGSSNLPQLRTALADWALDWGADYILFADADHVFPRGSLLRFLMQDKPVVGANYARRKDDTAPTAVKLVDGRPEWVLTTQALADEGAVEEVDRIGFGLVLIRADVFKATPKPWFVMRDDIGGGEDFFFCKAAKTAGFSIFVDHRVSWSTGHLHEIVLTMEMTHGSLAPIDEMEARKRRTAAG